MSALILRDSILERRRFTPTSLSSVTLKAWYDASQEAAADGTSLSSISDHSGNGKTLSQATGSLQPKIQTDSDGRRYYAFDGVDDNVKASTASDWAFLNNTGNHSVFIVAACVAHSVDGRDTIIDTGGASSANVGLFFAFDNRGGAGLGGPDGVLVTVAKGTSGTFGYSIPTTLDSAPSAQRHIFALHGASGVGAALRINGNRGETDSVSATLGGTTPLGALCMGARTSGTALPGHIKVQEIILCSGDISTAEREQVLAYLARKWAGVCWSDAATAVTVENTATFDAFPTMAQASNGDIIIIGERSTTNASLNADLVQWRSTDGGATWGASSIIFNHTLVGGSLGNPGIVRLRNGTLLLTCNVPGDGTAGPDSCRWATSTDNGSTWSALNSLNDAFTGFSTTNTRVLELPNGDLLWPIYGNNTGIGNSTRWIKVYKSTDGGASWSYLADIGAAADATGWGETSLVRSATTGNIIALIRNNTAAKMYRSVSTDSGATWTAPSVVQVDSNSSPQPCWTARGALVIAQRDGATGNPGVIYTSLDDGANWTKGKILTNGDFRYGSPVSSSRNVLIPYSVGTTSTDADVSMVSFSEI